MVFVVTLAILIYPVSRYWAIPLEMLEERNRLQTLDLWVRGQFSGCNLSSSSKRVHRLFPLLRPLEEMTIVHTPGFPIISHEAVHDKLTNALVSLQQVLLNLLYLQGIHVQRTSEAAGEESYTALEDHREMLEHLNIANEIRIEYIGQLNATIQQFHACKKQRLDVIRQRPTEWQDEQIRKQQFLLSYLIGVKTESNKLEKKKANAEVSTLDLIINDMRSRYAELEHLGHNIQGWEFYIGLIQKRR